MEKNTSSSVTLPPYEQPQTFTTRLAGKTLSFVSKPGLPDWRTVAPPAALLAEHAALPAAGCLLWLGCGHAAAAVALARRFPQGRLALLDTSYIALQMATRTLELNQVQNAAIIEATSILPAQASAFGAAVIDLPKSRKLAQRWLLEAWHALHPTGWLFLAGANDQGIQPVIKDASQLFGPPTILDYKKGSRVVRFTRTASTSLPEWASQPGVAPGSWYELDIQIPQGAYHLHSLPGIFSFDRLDDGTRLLLEHLKIAPQAQVLDLGCGYGILGLVAAQNGAAQVDLVDASLLAVAAAQRNLEMYNIQNARALPSDALQSVQGQQYDLIISNPPFHAGKAIEYQMTRAFIHHSSQALQPGGRMLLVANRFIRYNTIMTEYFSQVTPLAQTNQYITWEAIK